MANYNSCGRTNYFHVKDMDKFEEIVSRIMSEDNVETFRHAKDASLVGFTAPCGINGLYPEDYSEDDDYDACTDDVMNALKGVIADGDAMLYFEIGHEKMRYVDGEVWVVTSENVMYRNLDGVGKEIARTVLGNSEWDTQTDY